MTPFSNLLLAFSVVVFALAWLKGGHPERFGALILTLGYLEAMLLPVVKVMGDLVLFDAIADFTLLVIFLWMALRGRRWWPFLATAVMFLTMMVHAAMVLIPELDTRADMSARMGLTLLLVLGLLAGIGERWLAGERPVTDPSTWLRPRPRQARRPSM